MERWTELLKQPKSIGAKGLFVGGAREKGIGSEVKITGKKIEGWDGEKDGRR